MSELPMSRHEIARRMRAALEVEAHRARADFTLAEQTNRAAIERRQRAEVEALKRAGATQARLEALAAKHADELRDGAAAVDERRKRLGHTVAIKGRFDAGGKVWDIFKLDGDARPVLVRSGFRDPFEAMAVANDLVLGRVPVSFAGVRGVFTKGRGMLVPDRSIDLPGRQGVRVAKVGDDVLLTTKPGATA